MKLLASRERQWSECKLVRKLYSALMTLIAVTIGDNDGDDDDADGNDDVDDESDDEDEDTDGKDGDADADDEDVRCKM